MRIPKSVVALAIPNKITVNREEHGIYTISKCINGELVSYIRQSTSGACAALRVLNRRIKEQRA